MIDVSDVLDAASKLTWQRAFAALLLLVMFLIGFWLYQSQTHSLSLQRAERAVALAERATAYRTSIGPAPSPEQLEIYTVILKAAHSAAVQQELASGMPARPVKFWFAFLPWLLMALVFVAGSDSGRFIGMFGAVVLGGLVAGGLTLVPAWYWPIGSLVILPVVAWLVVCGLFGLRARRRRTGTAGPQ
jgi:hypothetical protein